MDGFLVSRPGDRARFAPSIREMHHLRAEVFGTRLNWDVTCLDGEERDAFDELDPAYIMLRGSSGRVEASCRLLPTTGPYMLKDVFPQLLGDHAPPCDERVWEVSRFSVLPADKGNRNLGSLHRLTQELLIELIAVGLSNNLSAIVTVTDVRFERVLKRSDLIMEKYREALPVGNTKAVAGSTPVSLQNLSRLTRRYEELAGQQTDAAALGQEKAA